MSVMSNYLRPMHTALLCKNHRSDDWSPANSTAPYASSLKTVHWKNCTDVICLYTAGLSTDACLCWLFPGRSFMVRVRSFCDLGYENWSKKARVSGLPVSEKHMILWYPMGPRAFSLNTLPARLWHASLTLEQFKCLLKVSLLPHDCQRTRLSDSSLLFVRFEVSVYYYYYYH